MKAETHNVSCTVVPTHLPHFDFTKELVKSHNKYVKTDLYLVFSSQEEYEIFKTANHDLIFKHFIVTPFRNYNVITYKKFMAVNYLSNFYDYIGVFDDETVFVKELDTDKVYKEISDSKHFKSNRRHGNHLSHLKKVAAFMGYSENEILIDETDDFTQYWWFNEICVYNSSLFKEFIIWFNTVDNSQMWSQFMCFDYLLYSLWLIANKGYKLDKKLQDYSFAGAAVETNMNDDNISYEFMSYMDRNINHENIEHIKVQIMLDRDINHCLIEGEKRIWQK